MTRRLTRLTRAMDRRNAQWLENRYSDVADALRRDLEVARPPTRLTR